MNYCITNEKGRKYMEDMKREIISAFKRREATKEFISNKKIADEDFKVILEAGRLSPSSFGWEPWEFLVVQNTDLRMKLKDVSWGAQRQLPSASHFVIILGRRGSQMKPGSEYLHHIAHDINKIPEDIEKKKVDAFGKFEINDFHLDTDERIFSWVGKQAYIALANMMTAAALLGIDSCPMEGFNIDMVEKILSDEGLLDIEKFGVVAMVAFGYRKENLPYKKSRRPVDEVIKWVK